MKKYLNILVAWFGIFQTTHLLMHFFGLSEITSDVHSVFIYSSIEHVLKHDLAFSLAILDIVYSILSLIFVFAYFNQKGWSHWFGSICLALSLNSILLFDYITIATGTLKDHSFEFIHINAGFIPVLILLAVFSYYGFRNENLYIFEVTDEAK